MLRKFFKWLQDPNGAGKYCGIITTGTFLLFILGVFILVKLNPINVDATNGVSKDGINSVRMNSIEYVYTFDSSVDKKTKESILNYLYSTVDAVKLLHMVNMRQHVEFGDYNEIVIIEDTIYCPIDVSINELEDAINNLK